MARSTIVRVTDDLDGTEGAETLTFSLRGTTWEIDLGEKNTAALEQFLQPYMEAGRPVRGETRRGRRLAVSGPAATIPREKSTEIRNWAKANGHQVSERGRIAATIVEAYERAH